MSCTKQVNRKLIFLLVLFVCNLTLAQFQNTQGIPFIKNFTVEETKNNATIFDISQGDNGIMYFATPEGLLEYDGIRWKNYMYGLESDLRSVLYIDEKHIYTSGHGGFGYW